MIGVYQHAVNKHRIKSHQPNHILTPLITKSNFTQNPKTHVTILEQISRWIKIKLKTNVKNYDQNTFALTDLKINVWIKWLIKGRRLSLVRIVNVMNCFAGVVNV